MSPISCKNKFSVLEDQVLESNKNSGVRFRSTTVIFSIFTLTKRGLFVRETCVDVLRKIQKTNEEKYLFKPSFFLLYQTSKKINVVPC